MRLVGDTSYGAGCAEPGYPGVYGRVADTMLREWIRTIAPDAISSGTATTSRKKTKATDGTAGSSKPERRYR